MHAPDVDIQLPLGPLLGAAEVTLVEFQLVRPQVVVADSVDGHLGLGTMLVLQVVTIRCPTCKLFLTDVAYLQLFHISVRNIQPFSKSFHIRYQWLWQYLQMNSCNMVTHVIFIHTPFGATVVSTPEKKTFFNI